jgi:hypothetical protein
MTLPDVASMPAVAGLAAPREFWWARVSPVPLAGMPFPRARLDWVALHDAGFRTVVCLTADAPGYDAAPLTVVGVALEDLYGGRSPADAVAERDAVRRAVLTVRSLLDRGDGVVVHCAGGTGRTGTVVGGALVAAGEPVGDVARWLDTVHRARGRHGWPESPWQRDVLTDFADLAG